MLALASLLGCRALGPSLPRANLQEPGWTVREGQAVWHLPQSTVELAGEVLVATRADGRAFVQFTKHPSLWSAAKPPASYGKSIFRPNNGIIPAGAPPRNGSSGFTFLALSPPVRCRRIGAGTRTRTAGSWKTAPRKNSWRAVLINERKIALLAGAAGFLPKFALCWRRRGWDRPGKRALTECPDCGRVYRNWGSWLERRAASRPQVAEFGSASSDAEAINAFLTQLVPGRTLNAN